MADKTVKFLLDLDIKEFTEKAFQAKGSIDKIGEAEGIERLIGGLAQAGAALGTVGLAVFAFKQALDLTLEAEQLERVNKQFEMLSAQAGISAISLKQGLEEASKGLVDTSDLLETANKSIVAMGASAAKLPEIMELARKSTQVFGGDLKSNFENIAQAISVGNTRMLKHYGIVVDSEKAVKEFAKANNLAANEISESGKRQAILNQVLEAGQKTFKNVDGDMKSATSSIQLIKTSFSELGEVIAIVFNKIFGPSVRQFLTTFKEFMSLLKDQAIAQFGDGAEKSAAKVRVMEKQLEGLNRQLKMIQSLPPGSNAGLEQSLKQTIDRTQAQLDELKAQKKKHDDEEKSEEEKKRAEIRGDNEKAIGDDLIDKEARKQNELKFQKELQEIRKKALEEEAKGANDFTQLENSLRELNLIRAQEHTQKMEEIENNSHLNHTQKLSLKEQEERRYQASIRSMEQETAQTRAKLLDAYVKNSNSAFQGIGRAFQVQSLKSKHELQDFGKRGKEVMQSFQQNASSSFEQMGADIAKGKDIAAAAADAMKGFFLGMLGDRAIAEGSMLLLSGLWPPNPVALGAGAGLLALGGALKSLAGSSGGSVSASAGGGGGGQPEAAVSPTSLQGAQDDKSKEAPVADVAQMEKRQRAVNVQIAGNYFDTDSSRRALMEMIRAETDATDFRYDRIGVT